jgi:hypothetical protein
MARSIVITAGQIHTLRITLAHWRPIIDATESGSAGAGPQAGTARRIPQALAEDDDLIWALLGQIEGRTPEELMVVADGTTRRSHGGAAGGYRGFFPGPQSTQGSHAGAAGADSGQHSSRRQT